MSRPLTEIPLEELVLDSLLSDPKVVAAARAIQGELSDLLKTPQEIELFSRIDDLPVPVLRMLAWEMGLSNIEWQLALTDEDRRQLIRDAYEINALRGTRYAVQRVFEILRVEAQIEEWWEYGGNPYTFRISVLELGERGIRPEEFGLIDQLIYAYKPLRAWLDSIFFFITNRGDVNIATKLVRDDLITVYPKAFSVNAGAWGQTFLSHSATVTAEAGATFGLLTEDGRGILWEDDTGAQADIGQ